MSSFNRTDEVTSILEEATAEIILPRFRRIRDDEVHEKAPGDLVTIVDHEVEALMEQRLPSLLPGSRVIGEEGTAAHPGLLESLNDGWVWLVDPLDGTRNFVNGVADFATMVALLHDGVPQHAWIYSPATASMAYAERDGGAWWNGDRITLNETPTTLRGNVHTRFLPATWPETIRQRAAGRAELFPPCGSAGVTYPLLLQRDIEFILYWRTLPWDHVPGALMIQEAGGHVARLDGRRYVPLEKLHGLLVAVNEEVWHRASSLLPDSAGEPYGRKIGKQ